MHTSTLPSAAVFVITISASLTLPVAQPSLVKLSPITITVTTIVIVIIIITTTIIIIEQFYSEYIIITECVISTFSF